MPKAIVGKENASDIKIYYEDHGAGQPVVLIHGWPLSGKSWEKQVPALLQAGYRVITYDRRGFGQSSQPSEGYNYDTLAQDLNALLTHLDLQSVHLVGFSMGGGEVARYLGQYGSKRVRSATFISSITPYLLKTDENPDGVDAKVFEAIKKGIREDRPAFLKQFFAGFYNLGLLKKNLISEEAVQRDWIVAAMASQIGTHDSVSAWGEDFRPDLAQISIPTLVIHGDSDKTVPLENSGQRLPSLLAHCKLHVVEGGPHGLTWTHAEEVNRELLNFLGQAAAGRQRNVS